MLLRIERPCARRSRRNERTGLRPEGLWADVHAGRLLSKLLLLGICSLLPVIGWLLLLLRGHVSIVGFFLVVLYIVFCQLSQDDRPIEIFPWLLIGQPPKLEV